ncbi:ATP-binding cassette domain-containing protein [Alicyclobacillus acidiphilus]|uniref:ATP-binding cassette domain-containing protein n=1 Tax=Alicyclobacillus acidiphilus TaxID=182455 RepID=UPI0008348D01|nr:ATP-binding cassette domain-containing protein [Alicyclobacillus acidiphilus]
MLRFSLELPRRHFTVSVDLTVAKYAIHGLFGASATGKSSVLSAIAGFETGYRRMFLAMDDDVLVDTEAAPNIVRPAWQRGIAYLTQATKLFPHMSVMQNVLYGAAPDSDEKWIDSVLEALDLRGYLSSRPQQLSGGLAQRVALARALVSRPRVLLLDEPFSALDWMSRQTLQELVHAVHRQFGMTTIFVTHQLTEAQRLADTMSLIDEGRILQTGSPRELLESPGSWRAAQLMGYSGRIRDGAGRCYAIHADRTWLSHRPDLGISFDSIVQDIMWYEGRQRASVTPCRPWESEGPLYVTLPPDQSVQPGDCVTITAIAPPRLDSAPDAVRQPSPIHRIPPR